MSALDGSGGLIQGTGGRQPLELNQPLSTGDRVQVDRGSRVEIVLPEGGVARLAGGSQMTFAEVDPMDGGGQNALRLDDGSLQIVVGANGNGVGGSPIRVDTPNVTAYFDRNGRYLVETDLPSGWTRVVVREGNCELMTQAGSRELAAGDEAQIDGSENPRLADAGDWSQIETWGGSLDQQADRGMSRYVDPSLRYSSTQLAYNGSWASIDGQYAWRPRVDSSWRPYTHGRWGSTPSGLTWISSEPWGWVTSHYGNWDYRPDAGWIWFPGASYSPAWVYWYWGPTHVGWCPTGYYTHYYGSSYFGGGIRSGIYGWAGGWGGFLDWNFVPIADVGARGLSRYCRRGYDLRAELGQDGLRRGIITTDTRGAQRWTRPDDILRDWQVRGGRTRPNAGDGGLPDVSSFISRRRDLDPAVRSQISSIGGQTIQSVGGGRDRGTPRPEPWARQRPVERGVDSGAPAERGGHDAGGMARRETPPRAGEPSWRQPTPFPGLRANPTAPDTNAAWRRQGGAPQVDRGAENGDLRTPRASRPATGGSPWDARAIEPRQRLPERGGQDALRVIERRSPEELPGRQMRPDVRSRSVTEDRRASQGSGNEAPQPPIRRIVEGVRQTPPPSQSSEARRPEPSRSSERSDGQARTSRPSKESDRGRRDSGARHSEDGASPPPED